MYTETIMKLPMEVMEDGLEEEEIKIEYNESFERDPLCDKLEAKPFASYDVPVDLVSSTSRAQELEVVSNNNPSVAVCDSNSSTEDMEQVHFEDFIPMESPPTWYREIDDSGKFVCKFCDLTYSTIQTIRHHVKTKHPENAIALKDMIKNNKRNSKIKCHICNKHFKLISNLKDHMKEHHSDNLQQSCKVCFATFNDEQEMIQHLYHKHQNVPNMKTYSCAICGYRTLKLSHFKQHQNTHIRSKNLKCDFCDYATNYSPNLKIHLRIHYNDKPYACSYRECGYRCAAKSALRSHQLRHYPQENMLYCDKCTYTTVYRNSLKKHMDSHERNSLKDT